MTELPHLDGEGNAHMVDVGDKPVTRRTATASAVLVMAPSTKRTLFAGDTPKGDALAVARIAAIQAVKGTSGLIPLCHPLPVDAIEVGIEEAERGAVLTVTVGVRARTGVEMEAMTGAAIGALALYDMIKSLDRSASIKDIELLTKDGGRSGSWKRG